MHAQVAIALSLLTAEVTKPPFNKIICTFSSTPELHLVKGNTLVEQVIPSLHNHVQLQSDYCFFPFLSSEIHSDADKRVFCQVTNIVKMKWGMNTDLKAVFTLLLEVSPASHHSLTRDMHCVYLCLAQVNLISVPMYAFHLFLLLTCSPDCLCSVLWRPS